MRRAVATLAVILAIGGGIYGMAELTQSRADDVPPDSVTTIDFTVDTHRYVPGEEAAANALWTVCTAIVRSVPSPPVAHGDGWQATLTPALGEHGENRLVGCLEDLTLDRVMGDVLTVRSSA